MKQITIALHHIKYNSAFSVLCSLVTGSSFSHSSIILNDTLYDTTLSRGYFSSAKAITASDKRRLVTCFNISVSDKEHEKITEKVKELEGISYDLFGLLLWPFGVTSKDKYYCFTSTNEILKIVDLDVKGKVAISGRDILDNLLHSSKKDPKITYSERVLPVTWK